MSGIMITGAGGFLGKQVVNCFEEHGYKPYLILHNGRIDGDLCDQAFVLDYMKQKKPDVVIHLAAKVGGIHANSMKPAEFSYQNTAMGCNLIEAARKYNVKKFVLAGTVCQYPKFCEVPFRESDIFNGDPEETNSYYGYAKRNLMKMLYAYTQEYKMKGFTLIPANMYGPGDSFHLMNSHVIPALIRKVYDAKLAGDKSLGVWGTGKASREFLYVSDCARAIVKAVESYDGPEWVNIGTGVETTIEEVARLICKVMEFDCELNWNPKRPDGQPRRSLNIDRAKRLFNFAAQTSLEDGLRTTCQYYIQKRKELDANRNSPQ